MESFSFVNFCILAFIFFSRGVASRIIGNGLNINNNSLMRSSSLIKFGALRMNRLRLNDHPEENRGHQIWEESEDSSDSSNNMAVLLTITNNEHLKRIPTTAVSGIDKINPFLRLKREACLIPATLAQNISLILSLLNDTMFFGRPSELLHVEEASMEEQRECPTSSHDAPLRCRATRPWTISNIDLGENAFPRYIPQATCLSEVCIGSPSKRCQNLYHNVTYLERKSRHGGLSLMVLGTRLVIVGCYCVSGRESNPTLLSLPTPPTDFS